MEQSSDRSFERNNLQKETLTELIHTQAIADEYVYYEGFNRDIENEVGKGWARMWKTQGWIEKVGASGKEIF